MRQHRLVTFSGSRRVSRRAVLTDLGAAGVGLTILAACGGSSGDGAADTGRPATPAPPDTEPTATQPPNTETPNTETPNTEAAAPGGNGGLVLEHVSLGFVSAYVLLRGGEAAVVDTGTDGSAAAILDGLNAVGADWGNVGHIVLTHNHGDHIGGLAGVLAATPGATVYGGEADLGAIESSAPLVAVGDGDDIMGLGVLDTPGHTAGSISLFDTETGILVAGDAINGEAGTLTGANPQFTADPDEALASIAKLAALQPNIAAFGHGGAPITDDVTAQLEALAAG